MLRLVLSWFNETQYQGHRLSFLPDATWFSESLLTSPFLSRYRGDKLAEGYTHADGAIGHFDIGSKGKAELKLKSTANQLIITEAKMFSELAKRTIRVPNYNQAARNIACIAQILSVAKRKPQHFQSIAFFVIAPKTQIDSGIFSGLIEKDSIERVVSERIANYDPPKDQWFGEWFIPTLNTMQVECISWEELVNDIKESDLGYGSDLTDFYGRCLEFNSKGSS